jgi:predicted O-linked N-acetylglucosamine transferase (SPINDLY family)
MRLPHCYQITDNQQPIDPECAYRSTHGLPQDAFVFCSFNAAAKLDRNTFDCWMQILQKVPHSVLWLLAPSINTQNRLRTAAQGVGIDPERIVFAQALAKPQHLARLKLADLALDPLFCNSHTTGSDALWAGVPMLTLMGQTFASRVGASLLTAAGLNELITADQASYIESAVALSGDGAKMQSLRKKLSNPLELPLFQTEKTVQDLERVYLAMVERHNQSIQSTPKVK